MKKKIVIKKSNVKGPLIKSVKKAQLGRILREGAEDVAKVKIPPKLQASLAKSQAGPTKIGRFSSEAERIAAGHPTNLQRKAAGLSGYAKVPTKGTAPRVDRHGFDIVPEKNGGAVKKSQHGSFVPAKMNPKTGKASPNNVSTKRKT